ncbi:MAG: response regulator receiver protein [Verrucomicrobiales bacterium]|nr:response regulator receiver protein [Verrucomicrobiales bacterium]
MSQTNTILIVEDNQDDIFLMRRALKSSRIRNPIQIVEDGQKAIDYLQGASPYSDRILFPFPMVVFLDLQLPHKTGFDVLEWLKSGSLHKPVVVVLSSSNSPYDMERCAELGACHYAVKPPDSQLFELISETFSVHWDHSAPSSVGT